MPEWKKKPKAGRPTARPPDALRPKQAARQMKEKYIRELKQRPEDMEAGKSGYAPEQVERGGQWAVEELTDAAVSRSPARLRRDKAMRKAAAGKDPPPERHSVPSESGGPAQPLADAPAAQPTAETGRAAPAGDRRGPGGRAQPSARRSPQVPNAAPAPSHTAVAGPPPGHSALNDRRRGSAAIRTPSSTAGPRSAQGAPVGGSGRPLRAGNGARPAKARKERARPALKTRGGLQPRARPGPAVRPSAVRTPARRMMAGAAQQAARRTALREMAARTGKAAKATLAVTRKLTLAVTRAAAALVSSLMALLGGGLLLMALVIVIVIAAAASSPFGLFFAEEQSAPDSVSVAEAVAQVNSSYNARLETLQAGSYDDIEITGQAPDWPDVLAVFASRYAGAEDGVDVATLNADRVAKLTAVFWDMTAITSWVETVDHPGDSDSDGWTEYILHLSISAKTSDDMRTAYAFTALQNAALDELLADRAALTALAGSLNITSADARSVLEALPDGLAPERRAVVETALRLYGKVGYFWGGKSLVLGWDSRWGQLAKVMAAGSSTTGAYRPYGLDCSGYADWVFYNASGGSYVIGHGGGARMQHSYCTDIDWDEALPGDLVFYPEDEHVGIVCGYDESGGLLVIHCASGANSVVITGTSGFTSVARPDFYSG